MMSKPKGMSLIELITVVAIIGVISASGMASFSSLIGDRLEADARKIQSDLNWARQASVARRVDYIVDFDTVNENYIIYADTNDNGVPETSEEVDKQLRLDADVVSVTDEVGALVVPARITFNYPNGSLGIAGRFLTVNLAYQDRTREVRVWGNTGYTRIQ